MQMLYNSDNFSVLVFDLTVPADLGAATSGPTLGRGGYEIVDKVARKEIFIQGAMAESFKEGVEALINNRTSDVPSEEEFDAFIGRYTPLMQHPVVLH